MPFLDESGRAPAESPKMGLSGALATAITWLLWPVIGCRHRNTTLPYNDRQTCLDCGSSCLYLFHSDFEHADAGIFIGPWKRHTAPAQDAHRVVASKLIDNATRGPLGRTPANVPMNGREAILFAGADSPLFKPQRRAQTTATFNRVCDTANEIFDRHVAAGAAVQQ